MKPRLQSAADPVTLIFNQNQKITHFGRSGQINEAAKIFEQMTRRNTITYNSMISAYAKNGKIRDARQVFDRMPYRDVVSWNSMISGYLHDDKVEDAYVLFDRMPKRDSFSWTLLLTCYTRNGDLEKARELLNSLPCTGNPECWNAVISGFVKRGRNKDARVLFDKMPVKNIVSWNSMLSGYTKNGEMHLAVKFFEEMVEKDVFSWNLMLDGLVKIGDMDSAWQFFRKIPNPNVVSWVTMLCGFARSGKIVEARELFDTMPSKNIVSWNAMIAVYVQENHIDEANRLFLQMPDRTSVSWTTMINGYVRVGKLNEANELLNQMPYKNIAAQTAMISGYIQNKNINKAAQIFNDMGTKDVFCWNTMIAGYAQCGRMDEALCLFKKIPKKDIFSCNAMIHGYAETGQVGKALIIFKEMGEKNIVSWNSLISGLTQNGLYLDSLRCFMLMRQEGMRPDQSTFSCGLSACANLAALRVGKQIHHLILKSGFVHDLYVANALITMYSKCGEISSAEIIFKDTNRSHVVSWNSLIAGYAFNGYGNKAVELFKKMEVKGIVPDEVTFVGVLSACSHAGLIDLGLKLFKDMCEAYSLEPLAEHYACVVDLLSRAGRLEEAFELTSRMEVKPNAGIWGALLGASRVYQNTELGKIALEKLQELEPHKTSNRVLLSNAYAEAGKWDQVERLRMTMEREAVKQPACSWIDINSQIYPFLSGSRAQARKADIYKTLQNLTAQMRNRTSTYFLNQTCLSSN